MRREFGSGGGAELTKNMTFRGFSSTTTSLLVSNNVERVSLTVRHELMVARVTATRQ